MGSLLHFCGCGVSSMVRSNTVWDTMALDEVFSKFTHGSFGRSITCNNGKSITKIGIYSSKEKELPFAWRKWSNVVNLPLGQWVFILGRNSNISGVQCWSLLLAVLALDSVCSQIRLGEWQSMMLITWVTSISATMATLFICLLWSDRNVWRKGKKLTVHRTGHPVCLITKLLLCWSHLCWAFIRNITISTAFAHLERSTYILISQMSFS